MLGKEIKYQKTLAICGQALINTQPHILQKGFCASS